MLFRSYTGPVAEGTKFYKRHGYYYLSIPEGGEIALNIAKEKQVDIAILQRRSPSCGYSVIYDGTFTGNLVTGSGVFAQMLQGLNIPIMEAESEKFV